MSGKVYQHCGLSLLLYVNVVNYFIERFWTMKDFTSALADKVITGRAVNRFKITARLAQCAAKQAKEIVRSQRERKIKTMPLLRRKVATLDNRFVKIEEFKGEAFDLGLSFASGMPKVTIPISQTSHMNRFLGPRLAGRLDDSSRDERARSVGRIDLREGTPRTEDGRQGHRDRSRLQESLCHVRRPGDRRRVEGPDQAQRQTLEDCAYRHIKTELFRHLKGLRLGGVKTIVLEDLRYIKHGKRGTFSRHVNRLLSFWSLTRARRLAQMPV